MESDYQDLRFISGSCSLDSDTELNYEIELSGNTDANVWVQIPTLSIGTISLCMYYGNAGAVDGNNTAGTWDVNFEAVYHLVDSTTSITKDSTENIHTGTKRAANEPIQINGKISKAQDFDGSNDYISGGDFRPIMEYTAEAWIKGTTFTGSGDHSTYGYTIMASATSGAGYGLWLAGHGTEIRFWAFESTPSTGGWRETTGANLNTTDWFHIAATAVKSGASKVYVNGVEKLSFTNDGDVDWTSIFTIGDLRPTRAIAFDGIIDELRISNKIRSADWINQTYNLAANQSTYVIFGNEQSK